MEEMTMNRLFSRSRCILYLSLLAASLGGLPAAAQPLRVIDDHGHDVEDNLELRERAGQRVEWRAEGASSARLVPVKVLALNDFHGQITTGRTVGGRPVGSAPVLVSYLR